MADKTTNYQCPACTGPLHFDGASGKLVCDYCGSAYEVADIEARYAQKQASADAAAETEARKAENARKTAADGPVWSEAEAAGLSSCSCPTCGAELVCDETTAATTCPYCGNPTVVPGQFAGQLKPDFIIPFKYSKEDAVKALKEHYAGKIFLPKSFTNENHIQEIQGIYVPFWMFDGEAEGDAHYQATRSRTYTSGDYEITETRHFDVYRAGRVTFEKVPVDASSKMPDDHMDSIEPYDYKKLKPFSTAYLPGYLADKFDVTVEQSRERADQRCQGTLDAALRSSVRGYDTCIQTGGSSSLQRGKVHYALMPVWMLNTKWHGKDFTFAMNGQTGKLVGDLPMSWGRFWGLFAAIAAPLSILGTIVSVLMLR